MILNMNGCKKSEKKIPQLPQNYTELHMKADAIVYIFFYFDDVMIEIFLRKFFVFIKF